MSLAWLGNHAAEDVILFRIVSSIFQGSNNPKVSHDCLSLRASLTNLKKDSCWCAVACKPEYAIDRVKKFRLDYAGWEALHAVFNPTGRHRTL